MPIWAKLLIVLGAALFVTGGGWVFEIRLSAVHGWLLERIGHTGMRLVIGAMVLVGAWALWNEMEDR
ncbi:hypothetical protein [Methylobacterium organophilum]|uniref:Uncharacterized protein n=1 Tax=Methylobacterium organophilum TaxID=410 RepID=A0ABQ4T849_METOR|nr:hypothetical protein [Methylobacterium organophilum]UMY17231.1 hypothetical protein MMB17_21760 [Methylobacterium organophilum]GJE26734.1 hypothetical protein LKMONMHP_1585 [Methylobacterium organophilum]